mmetsp:Transcript_34609/g.62741  ORF Transcript_34609/g.62741 Transcript_34609/m.62741 type:complete len:418 (+) Transcript_34609:27-1280(+)
MSVLATISSWLGLDDKSCCNGLKELAKNEAETPTEPAGQNQFMEEDMKTVGDGGASPSTIAGASPLTLSDGQEFGMTDPDSPKGSVLSPQSPKAPSVAASDYSFADTAKEERQVWNVPSTAPLDEDQVVIDGLRARLAKASEVLPQLQERVHAEILAGKNPEAGSVEERELSFCTSSTLTRYLCMQDSNVDKACEAIKFSMAWRSKNITPAQFLDGSPVPRCRACAKDPLSHCFLCLGEDVMGRHVVYSCAGRAANKVPEDGIEHMSSEMERLFNNSSEPGAIVWIVDFAGFGFGDCNPRTGVLAFPMFASHYPERFGQIVCLGLPMAFYPLYSAAGKIFDQATMQKVVILKGDKAFKRYGDAYWSNDPAMKAWLYAAVKCKGVPGSFPDISLTRAIRNRPSTELAMRTLERINGSP